MNQTVQRIRKGIVDRINEGWIYRVWWANMDPDDVGCMAPPWRDPASGNCFPGDTKVTAPGGVDKSYKSFYEGPLVRIETALGHDLSGTPNHPILTRRGWVPIGELKIGDHVVSRSSFGKTPDDEDAPTPIEKVHSALSSRGVVSRGPIGAFDFHGDRPHSEVEVVSVDGELGDRGEPAILEHLGKLLLSPSYEVKQPLVGFGSLRFDLSRVRLATARLLSFFGSPLPVLVGGSGEPCGSGFGVGAQGDASVLQPTVDNVRAYSHPCGDLRGRFAGEIRRHDVVAIKRGPARVLGGIGEPKLGSVALTTQDAGLFQSAADHQSGDAEFLSAFADGLPADILFDEVVHVDTHPFAGHVYTLQSSRGWYTAHSIISRNCTSTYNDDFGEMRDEGYPVAPIGGTGDWANALQVWERPVLAKNYPPGYFGVSPYVSDEIGQWGHVQMVWSGEAADGNQIMAQSDMTQGMSADNMYGWPGPNVSYTMEWSWNNIDWPAWIGLVPGVRPIDGFPGYDAHAYEIVRWYAKVCEWWYGMPLIIPINCIATELSTVIDPARTGSIWDIPGYSTPADHDSYGQHQQRQTYYPCPWNFETAAWSFMARVDKVLGSDAYPNPDDPRAVAELLQDAQHSFADGSDGNPLGWNYEEDYAWARKIVDEAMGEAEPASPTDPPKKIEWTKLDGIWVAGDRGHVWGELNPKTGKVSMKEW